MPTFFALNSKKITSSKISFYLRLYAEEYDTGEVFTGEVGIYVNRDPDTVRAMDAAYISWERLSRHTRGYFEVPPEVVVEVLSPGNRWGEIVDKVEEYLNIGVDLVWVIDPKREEVFAFETIDTYTRFAIGDTLTAGNVLPGFALSVEKLFHKGRRNRPNQ